MAQLKIEPTSGDGKMFKESSGQFKHHASAMQNLIVIRFDCGTEEAQL